jgi:hypothetical protein
VKFKTNAPTGHDANKLVDLKTGAKYYRSLKIHKNSWGEDDIRKGMAFQGAYGNFKCLPKFSDTTDEIYNSVLNGNYFLEQKPKKLLTISEALKSICKYQEFILL